MPDESPIDLDEHVRLIAADVARRERASGRAAIEDLARDLLPDMDPEKERARQWNRS